MRKLSMEDVFKALAKPFADFEVKPGKTALLLIDMQRIVSADVLVQEAAESGLPVEETSEALEEYDQTVIKVLRNAQRILWACRKKDYDVIHIKLGAQTNNPVADFPGQFHRHPHADENQYNPQPAGGGPGDYYLHNFRRVFRQPFHIVEPPLFF